MENGSGCLKGTMPVRLGKGGVGRNKVLKGIQDQAREGKVPRE